MGVKIAIIGSGPAGIAAALQLYRYGIKAFVFEKSTQGSLLINAWQVENYLGCYSGVSGRELLQLFRSRLPKDGIKKIYAQVNSLDYNSKTHCFIIKTPNKVYSFNYVVVASGTKPKLLIKNPPVSIKNYLFYEVFPLLKKRKKTILIIGGGDAAFDYALNLAKFNQVIICNRTRDTRDSGALPLLVKKAKNNCNITYFGSHELCGITSIATKKNLGVILTNQRERVYIEADYLLVAIGRTAQKDFYTDKLQMFEKKLIRENRLFLAGDVKNDIYRQVAIATSDGIITAMKIFHDLAKLNK